MSHGDRKISDTLHKKEEGKTQRFHSSWMFPWRADDREKKVLTLVSSFYEETLTYQQRNCFFRGSKLHTKSSEVRRASLEANDAVSASSGFCWFLPLRRFCERCRSS